VTPSHSDPVELPDAMKNAPGRRFRFPLYAQIFLAVTLGSLLGAVAGREPFVPGGHFGNDDLGQLAVLLTTILKTLASPLIFRRPGRFLAHADHVAAGSKLLLFCLINVTAAMTIGLFVMNTWQPGEIARPSR